MEEIFVESGWTVILGIDVKDTVFPWWLSDKEPAYQCRRCTFDP